jgi:hypothetical protein
MFRASTLALHLGWLDVLLISNIRSRLRQKLSIYAADPHNFYAAPVPGKNCDTAPASVHLNYLVAQLFF